MPKIPGSMSASHSAMEMATWMPAVARYASEQLDFTALDQWNRLPRARSRIARHCRQRNVTTVRVPIAHNRTSAKMTPRLNGTAGSVDDVKFATFHDAAVPNQRTTTEP